MNYYRAGVTAGLIATSVLSLIMALKAVLGVMPQVNAIAMLTAMSHARLGLPASPAVGWIEHFVIGTVIWGMAFAWFVSRSGSLNRVVAGIAFSIAAWLAMMLILMPLAGAGVFGLQRGIAPLVVTLVLHVVYGTVLGWCFGRLLNSGLSNQATDGLAADQSHK